MFLFQKLQLPGEKPRCPVSYVAGELLCLLFTVFWVHPFFTLDSLGNSFSNCGRQILLKKPKIWNISVEAPMPLLILFVIPALNLWFCFISFGKFFICVFSQSCSSRGLLVGFPHSMLIPNPPKLEIYGGLWKSYFLLNISISFSVVSFLSENFSYWKQQQDDWRSQSYFCHIFRLPFW